MKKPDESKRALTSAMDGDPKIRAALIGRITKAAEHAPVILLHQIAQMIELAGADYEPKPVDGRTL